MSGTAASNPDLQTIDAVGGAINQWRTSIAQFAEDHTEYVHLDSLTLTVYVQGFNDTLLRGRPDVRISFTDTLPSLLAETNLYITNTPQITSANTTAAVQGLSKQGLQNVLVHEIGHVFGISHTEFENDTMYGEREKQVVSTERLCPSTLDLYALASLYQWIQTGVYRPYAGTSVTLPQNITYQTVAYG
jgi:predicted Zn-dependent protease